MDDLRLRVATIDDLLTIADLAAVHDPDEPPDPEMLRLSWEAPPAGETIVRMLGQENDTTLGYLAAGHGPWIDHEGRFGWIRTVLPLEHWTESRFLHLVRGAEDWQRTEGTTTAVARLRERFGLEIAIYKGLGYSAVRNQRNWELDLVSRREQLLAAVKNSRVSIKDLGIQLLTLDRETDPHALKKIYDLAYESEQDVPTTVPINVLEFDEWRRVWFDNPMIREDRTWIARQGDAIVGISMIGFPPTRGTPSTWYTGTARSVRGRGIARALKYETVAQAILVGAKRIRTSNDGENAAILHLNAQMGYEPIDTVVELHRDICS
jgi:GNAT superfamily N-acetyltransferase